MNGGPRLARGSEWLRSGGATFVGVQPAVGSACRRRAPLRLGCVRAGPADVAVRSGSLEAKLLQLGLPSARAAVHGVHWPVGNAPGAPVALFSVAAAQDKATHHPWSRRHDHKVKSRALSQVAAAMLVTLFDNTLHGMKYACGGMAQR